MMRGLILTGTIGLIAGTVGIVVGVILGFVSGFFGGPIDLVVRWITEVLLTIPALILLIIIAGTIIDKNQVTIYTMAGVTSLLAWVGPTRVVRSQVLTMKERTYVQRGQVVRYGQHGIIFKELMPNMLPFWWASFGRPTNGSDLCLLRPGDTGLGPSARTDDRYDDSLGYLSVGVVQPVVVVGFVARRRHGAYILMPGTDQSGFG